LAGLLAAGREPILPLVGVTGSVGAPGRVRTPAVVRVQIGATIRSSALKHNMREVYFHEDDYCQLELLPEANWDFCAKQMNEIEKFSEAHKAEIGWTDMFMRSENPKQLSEVEIERAALVSSVREILPPFDRVLTGYGSHSEECQHTIALVPYPVHNFRAVSR
jgi:hypothetical protein